MSKKSVTKNYIYNLTYQILVIIVPLITTPYLSRVLGAEAIGVYSYTLSITTYFVLFGSLGVAMYGQREIAYVQDDSQKRSKIFYEIFLMRLCTLGLSMIIFYFTFVSNGEYGTYYKILLLEIVANIIDISWFFQGMEEFKKTVMRNTIIKVISVICIFIFVKTTNDLYKYFIIYVLSNLLGNASLWFYLKKYIEKVEIKTLNIFRHLKPTIMLFIPQIAIEIYAVLDKTMLGSIISDKSEVGFYEQAQKIVKLLLTIATALGTVMMPRIANTFADGKEDEIKRYLHKSFQFVLLLSFPLMFGIISVSNKFVPVFYGDGYEKVVYLICVISPIIIAIGLSNVIGKQYLLPTKRQKEFTISVVAGAVVNVVLNLICINLWKSIGASIATVAAECTVTGIQFFCVRKEIKFIDILKIAKNYFVAALIMFAVSILINTLISNNILSIIVQVCVGTIVYFVVLLIMKDELVIEIKQKIMHILVKN